MSLKHFSVQSLNKSLGNLLESFEISHGKRLVFSWFVLIIGLVIWTSVQSYLVLGPLWTRALPPEVDDSLAFLVRTQIMEECPAQDCPALQDLRKQILVDTQDPDIARQRMIAGFPFPSYHPLFSILLLLVKKFSLNLVIAYKVVWSICPVLFGVAFAYLLTSLWGKPAAGIALGLLAFKVFPGSRLHFFNPGSFALLVACFVWARIISRGGYAPVTLVVGSIVQLAIHPIGAINTLISVLLTLLISGSTHRRRAWIAVLLTSLILGLVFALASLAKQVSTYNVFNYVGSFPGIFKVIEICVSNATEAFVQIVRLKSGMFGSFSLFCLAVSFGFFLVPKERRVVAAKTVFIFILILFGSLYHRDPFGLKGDLFLRMWIPIVVIFFGAVGISLCYTFKESLHLLKSYLVLPEGLRAFSIQKVWPSLVLALLLGYSIDMTLSGSEQIYATRDHMQKRQALKFVSGQPKMLLSQARPGDRVLYTGTMIMSSYFLHGAMQLGAVYYHPVFKKTEIETEWLRRNDLRFAAVYNPTVYHPSLEGLEEKRKCITRPDFHYSPLSKPRKYGPISRLGFIPAADFNWIQIAPKKNGYPKCLRMLVRNTGNASEVELIPVGENDNLIWQFGVKNTVPARWKGWIEFPLHEQVQARQFRIRLPKGRPEFDIGGLVFGRDKRNWPWKQEATLTLQAKEPDTGKVVLSFDPVHLLPFPLKKFKITVLHDRGSSVLLKIDR